MEEWMKRMVEKMHSERRIVCPYCKHQHSVSVFEDSDLVTYHGGDDTVEVGCHSCEKDFFVREHVTRTFKEGKTSEDAWNK